MFCKNCGSKLSETGGFCPNCGAKSSGSGSNPNLGQASGQGSNMNPNYGGYQPPRNNGGGSGWQVVAIVLAALVVFVGAAGGIYLMMSDSRDLQEDRDGQNSQVENSQNGNSDDADADSSSGQKGELESENQELKAEEEALMEENERLRARIDYLSESIYRDHSDSQVQSGGTYFGNSYYISWSDLDGLSRADIELLRNEIYARNGYVFQEARFENYFSSMSWYRPNSGFHEGLFNSVERENVDLIVDYETYMGWR